MHKNKGEKVCTESNTVQELDTRKLVNKTLELIWRQA